MKKSYHSTVVPIRLASVTSLRLRSSATGPVGLPAIAESIAPPCAERSRRPESAGRRPDEITTTRSSERRLDQHPRLLRCYAITRELCADLQSLEPRRELVGRPRQRDVEDAGEH